MDDVKRRKMGNSNRNERFPGASMASAITGSRHAMAMGVQHDGQGQHEASVEDSVGVTEDTQ